MWTAPPYFERNSAYCFRKTRVETYEIGISSDSIWQTTDGAQDRTDTVTIARCDVIGLASLPAESN